MQARRKQPLLLRGFTSQKQKPSSTAVPNRSTHVTARVWLPMLHDTLQRDHGPVEYAYNRRDTIAELSLCAGAASTKSFKNRDRVETLMCSVASARLLWVVLPKPVSDMIAWKAAVDSENEQ